MDGGVRCSVDGHRSHNHKKLIHHVHLLYTSHVLKCHKSISFVFLKSISSVLYSAYGRCCRQGLQRLCIWIGGPAPEPDGLGGKLAPIVLALGPWMDYLAAVCENETDTCWRGGAAGGMWGESSACEVGGAGTR